MLNNYVIEIVNSLNSTYILAAEEGCECWEDAAILVAADTDLLIPAHPMVKNVEINWFYITEEDCEKAVTNEWEVNNDVGVRLSISVSAFDTESAKLTAFDIAETAFKEMSGDVWEVNHVSEVSRIIRLEDSNLIVSDISKKAFKEMLVEDDLDTEWHKFVNKRK